jgi:hypothetical protein
LPSKEELKSMSDQINKDTINLVHKLDDIPPKDFRQILPKDLSVKNILITSYSPQIGSSVLTFWRTCSGGALKNAFPVTKHSSIASSRNTDLREYKEFDNVQVNFHYELQSQTSYVYNP